MDKATPGPNKINKQLSHVPGRTLFFKPVQQLHPIGEQSTFFQPTPIIQRKCAACEEAEQIQMKRSAGVDGNAIAPAVVNSAIESGGNPLDPSSRNFMESRFGYHFGNVLVHDDSASQKSGDAVNALAYTYGKHIVFGTDQYQPHTNEGKQLLAHELTHVIQQQGTIQRKEKPATSKQATPAASPITFTCNPVECTHDEYVALAKKNGYNAADSFGITVLDPDAVSVPAIALGADNKLLPTTTAAVIQSSFIKAGQIFKDDSDKLPGNRDFTCDDSVLHYLISKDGAEKIKEGEMEHCADFKLAFDLTFDKYTRAVNKVAARKNKFKDQAAAEAAVEKITQVPYGKWMEKFNCFSGKTTLRDTRLYHKPMTISARMYPTQSKCKFPVMDIAAKHFPAIGAHLSKDLIKGCD